jgi:hypothetical protein
MRMDVVGSAELARCRRRREGRKISGFFSGDFIGVGLCWNIPQDLKFTVDAEHPSLNTIDFCQNIQEPTAF